MKNNKGFTLLEILLVVGIIGILSAIVIIAINPGRSLAKARDVQRKVGITEINKGLSQYYIDNGFYPSTITPELKSICVTGSSATSTGIDCAGKIDLSMLVPTYLPAIPADPTGVGYKVGFNSSRRVMLVASLTELGPPYIAIGTSTYVADICDGTPAIGTECADGTVYAGPGYRTTKNDELGSYPLYNWQEAIDKCAAKGSVWRLPTKDELEPVLYNNRSAIGGFNTYGGSGSNYWSSTEMDSSNAYSFNFYVGVSGAFAKTALGLGVRCVRRP